MKKIKRREFIRTGILAGGATIIGSSLVKTFGQEVTMHTTGVPWDIVTISGSDPFGSMQKLLRPLGGIGNFVKTGQSVGILVNSPWKNAGYFTNPDVALAIASLALQAGAREIVCFKPVPNGYWERSVHYSEHEGMISRFLYGGDRVEAEIPQGISLKKAEIFKIFNDVDVYISLPVAKHHNGTIFSGNLKGLMGVSSSATNRHMHSPDGTYTYDNHEYLAQCIADLNLIRKPDLCVVDAIECALENGPAGPGATVKPNKLLAGTDPLALDVYSAELIGFRREDILTFERAEALGIGRMDTENMKILEL
jgi:uncharacterized protein (DUF362 family)